MCLPKRCMSVRLWNKPHSFSLTKPITFDQKTTVSTSKRRTRSKDGIGVRRHVIRYRSAGNVPTNEPGFQMNESLSAIIALIRSVPAQESERKFGFSVQNASNTPSGCASVCVWLTSCFVFFVYYTDWNSSLRGGRLFGFLFLAPMINAHQFNTHAEMTSDRYTPFDVSKRRLAQSIPPPGGQFWEFDCNFYDRWTRFPCQR